MVYKVTQDKVLLTRIAGPGHGDNVLFMRREGKKEGNPTLFIDARTFSDFGSPERITVTVEPGNTLSGDGR